MISVSLMNVFFCIKYIHNMITALFIKKHIEILHHSKNVVILNKDFDLKINSNKRTEMTVQTLLKRQYPSLANEKLFHEYYFPHRLDFATSGIICIALHREACKIVSNTFSMRKAKKYYVALVRGLLSEEIIDIDIPIGEDSRFREIQKMNTANSEFCTKPRNARTIIMVLEEGTYDNYPATKILVRPVTGRRHQIRVHCSYLGHTIVGDYTYSNRKDISPFRMFLHSLRLVLPLSIEYVDIETCDPFFKTDKWCSRRIINEINETTYNKIECYI